MFRTNQPQYKILIFNDNTVNRWLLKLKLLRWEDWMIVNPFATQEVIVRIESQ
jgi:hypothetical protein